MQKSAKTFLGYITLVLDHFFQTITKYKEFYFYVLMVAPANVVKKTNVVEENSTSNCLNRGQLEYFSLDEILLILLTQLDIYKQIYTDDRS